MEHILSISMLLIGLAVGAGACWLVVNTKLKHIADNARSEVNAENSGLRSDINNRNEQITRLKTEVSDGRTTLKEIRDEFTTLKAREAQLETIIKQEPLLRALLVAFSLQSEAFTQKEIKKAVKD